MSRSPAPAHCRVLLALDLSLQTTLALRTAEELLAARPVAIDAYYLWPEAAARPDEAGDQAMEALASLVNGSHALDRLDYVAALERRGLLDVRGWLTRASQGGHGLTELARREGYDLVVAGISPPPALGHRFSLHRATVADARPRPPLRPRLALARPS